ncbi:hypothetical protein SDC9_160953 [bioreactor metagenome]|uniref:Uncharacterized protein n=1 Tax=bioreactor metagenome TaxID=1076179 RepID=A0A645FGX6_9ZZZZ
MIICNDWAVFGPLLYFIGHCRFCFFWIAYGEASIRYFGRLKEIIQRCGCCEHEVHAPCRQHGGQSNKNQQHNIGGFLFSQVIFENFEKQIDTSLLSDALSIDGKLLKNPKVPKNFENRKRPKLFFQIALGVFDYSD